MVEKIKFPFEPNERVKAAFRNEVARIQAIDVMTKSLLEASIQVANPWGVLRREHPELCDKAGKTKVGYNYNHFTEMVDIKENP